MVDREDRKYSKTYGNRQEMGDRHEKEKTKEGSKETEKVRSARSGKRVGGRDI